MTIKEVSEMTGLSQDTLRYYERIGMIPEVPRTSGGLRNYGKKELEWIDLAKCMRSAGLPIEVMIDYLKLYQEGDSTIPARLSLLKKQMAVLEEQKSSLEKTMERLSYKIERYEEAMKTGVLSWLDKEYKRNEKIGTDYEEKNITK